MTAKRKTLTLLAITAVIISFVFISLDSFVHFGAETALRRAGFPDARIERAALSRNGLNLVNITFGGGRYVIESIDATATPHDIFNRRLGRITVTNPMIRLAARTDDNNTEASPLTLPDPFVLPAREIIIDTLNIITSIQDTPVNITATVHIKDTGDDYTIDVTYESDIDLNGRLDATVSKTGANVTLAATLAETSLGEDDFSIRRLQADIAARIENGVYLPPTDLRIDARAEKMTVNNVPVENIRFDAALTPDESVASFTAQIAKNGGHIKATAKHAPDAVSDKLDMQLDIALDNLDTLNLPDVKGRAKIRTDITAAKDKTAAWQDIASYRDMNGTATVTANKLTLGDLVKKGQADLKLNLSFAPDTREIRVKTTEGVFSSSLLSLKSLAADILVPPDLKIRGDFSARDVALKTDPVYIIPLNIAATVEPDGDTLRLRGDITENGGVFAAKIRGRHDLKTKSGRAVVHVPPITLVAGVHKISRVFPVAADYIDNLSGTIGATVRASWPTKGKTATTGSVMLRDVTMAVGENALQNVNAVLSFSSLTPPVIERQKIAVGALQAGLPLTAGLAEISLDAKGRLTLHHAEWEMAGGKVVSSAFTTALDDISGDVTLTARDIQLPALFRIAPMEGLDATGTVNGVLPLKIRDGKIAVENGVLESAGTGAIRYNPQQVPAFMQGGEQSLVDLRVALKAFEFESLKMTLGGALGAEQKIGLSIKGKNPEFYDGYPVNLNLNVEGPLEAVLKSAPGNKHIPDVIKKQLEQYEKENEQ